jgi:bifunctional DNA-binding transcriptional regulator/antitoxin component of YhaV-PrlF toxin-antitoxin module
MVKELKNLNILWNGHDMRKSAEHPKVSALKVSTQGQVTLSKEARQQHEINAGDTLIEVSLPGCIVLLPESQVLGDLMFRAQQSLKKLGLTPDKLKENVNRRRKGRLSKRYPGVFDGET